MNIELNTPTRTVAAAATALVITWVMSWGFVDATRVKPAADRAETMILAAASEAGGELIKASSVALLK